MITLSLDKKRRGYKESLEKGIVKYLEDKGAELEEKDIIGTTIQYEYNSDNVAMNLIEMEEDLQKKFPSIREIDAGQVDTEDNLTPFTPAEMYILVN